MVTSQLTRSTKGNDTPDLLYPVMTKRSPEARGRADGNSWHQYAIVQLLSDGVENNWPNTSAADQIWRAESIHRSQGLLQLILLGKFQTSLHNKWLNVSGLECRLAQNLADAYNSLNVKDECEHLPCEEVVHLIVEGLLSTFQNSIGTVELSIHTRPLIMYARKRRALVLLISQLVIDLLLDKADRDVAARLVLTFSRGRDEHVNIKIETTCPLSRSFLAPGYDIVCGLAGIIGAEILFSETRAGGTDVEVILPLNRHSGTILDMVISE